MADGDSNDDAGERLGAMVLDWAEVYWRTQETALRRQGGVADSELRDAVLKAFTAGAVAVFQRWDEVRPLVPRRRPPWRDLPTHHG